MTEKKLRGFAALKARDPERMKAIARKGGQSIPEEKRSFSRDPELASRAGTVGGKNSALSRALASQD